MNQQPETQPGHPEKQMAVDPVCGMQVDPDQAPGGSTVFKGQIYYFCTDEDREQFEANPERYLSVH